jgi:hypothetical protein
MDTSAVIDAARTALQEHASYKPDLTMEGATRFRAILGKPSDPSREIILTVIIVPIPKAA